MRMTKVIDVVQLFYGWMDRVNAKFIEQAAPGQTPLQVHRHAGHIKEILEKLQQLDDAGRSDIKYPAVFLITDVRERIGQEYGSIQTAILDILIVNTTDKDYRIDERREQNFIPVLWPIYKNFIEVLLNAKEVQGMSMQDLPHDKIDRYYLGRQSVFGNLANKLNDYVDAVEIRDLRIQLKTHFC